MKIFRSRQRPCKKKISISISIAAKLDHLRRRNTCAFSAAGHNEPPHPFRGYGKSGGNIRLLTPSLSIRGSIGVLRRATGRFKSTRPDLRVADYTWRVKSERFHARGHFPLNPRATAKTILAWRENIFSHGANKTRALPLQNAFAFLPENRIFHAWNRRNPANVTRDLFRCCN